ncbi:zinc ribbon domain-containing protein [Pandoraea sp.]|uniref:Zn-ribbon domain-containing OB-fold protein n=1 Tax=Pandoraea sp. TaxID=1883445 RepID=UPI0011F4C5E8|nr:zinc ribbon domain-containing protein [Pandoraea sp.]TAL55969.1 MAG: DNA-binding protein [Pandoraea sp.]TAM20706.1 MAG: DNA-binding protein [Pandoraea sp.]
MELMVFRCRQCGTTLFPSRYLCPQCGADQWAEVPAGLGTIEQATVVRHRVGVPGAGDAHLASVRTSAGPMVVARLDQALPPGEVVTLTLDDAMRVLAHPARR